MSEAPAATQTPTAGQSISLVLGSGGARGYAHIGVIEELRAQGFAIDSIAGSSMGALVGGVHAAGKLDAYRDWSLRLARLDILRLIDISFRGGGLIKGNRVIRVLRELVGDVAIENLPIRYTAVAVDLDAQSEVWFTQGPLFDAIRASIAIPTIFRPHRHRGRLLVDGGLLNPLPIAPTLRDDTDATIAVDVNGPDEPLPGFPASQTKPASEKKSMRMSRARRFGVWRQRDIEGPREPNMVELFSRTLDTVQEAITRLRLAEQPLDLLITIPRNACAFYDFHRAIDLIELGRQRTREALARWQRPQLLP